MDDKINYNIIRSVRRTIAIVLNPDGKVTVRAPYQVSGEFIDNLVREKQNWIWKKLSVIESKKSKIKPKEFTEGEEFPYLGKMYRLRIIEEVENVVEIRDELLFDSHYKDNILQVMKVFYKYKACQYLEERVKLLSQQTGLAYKSIKITNGKKRLGTCSIDNRLTFSYLLVMMPENISDYIIYHELSHIKEKNHSAQFWEVVRKFVPDYKQRKKWLKENLYLYSFLD